MAVDKNLFLHDLSIVASLKDEGHYLKEWLDYHLLAGVDHFYLYDHESTDNYNEIIKPYVEAGLVTSTVYPNEVSMYAIYNDAVKQFKFQNRYMAFIDLDEFIYPKSRGGGVVEVVDKILSQNPNAGGLAMHNQIFGSNGQEKADLSKGVLERFTRRAPKNWAIPIDMKGLSQLAGNCWIKDIVNPRKINFFHDPHTMNYFEGFYTVDETSTPAFGSTPFPIVTEKIVINHYYTKSREEYFIRKNRKTADLNTLSNVMNKLFDIYDRYEEFDDGILHYRAERAKNFRPPDLAHADERVLNALTANLSPTLISTTPPQFYAGKMETFLTCRAVADYLKTRLTDAAPAKFYEEAALKATLRTLASGGMSLADARLLLSELPNILPLPYPVVSDLRGACLNIIPQMMNIMHVNNMWKDYVELDYLQRLLQTWK